MRAERANVLRELLRGKGKVVVIKSAKLLEEFREKMTEKGEPVSRAILDSCASPGTHFSSNFLVFFLSSKHEICMKML